MADKLEPRSDKCIFVGYPKETKGYNFYKPDENKVYVARRGVFLEDEYLSKADSGSKVYLEEIPEDTNALSPEKVQDHHLDIVEVEPELSQQLNAIPSTISKGPRRSERIRQEPFRYGLMISAGDDSIMMESDDPTKFQEAMGSPDSDKWLGAMKEEMKFMYDNQV